jgi:hypothetical protein
MVERHEDDDQPAQGVEGEKSLLLILRLHQ